MIHKLLFTSSPSVHERPRHTMTGNPGTGWAVFSSGGSIREEPTSELVQAAGRIQLLAAAG